MSHLVHSFSIEEAQEHGVEKAVILYNFRFWLTKNQANSKNIVDGYVWTFNSAKALELIFPYLNAKKIARLIKELELAGALITGNHNQKRYDRTKWYTMPEFAFKAAPIAISQKCEMDFSNLGNAFPKSGQPIPDSKQDNKPDIKKTKQKKTLCFDDVPDNINRDLVLDYVEMRKNIKSPMTQKAVTILINKINTLVMDGQDANQLLETAILNNWKSVYPERGNPPGGNQVGFINHPGGNDHGQVYQQTKAQTRALLTDAVLDLGNTNW